MFRSMLREFNDDTIFGMHNDQMLRMERMMNGLMPSFDDMFGPPFGMGGFSALMEVPGQRMDPTRRGPRSRSSSLLPFGFSNVFSEMGRLAPPDPNCHSFSSSSVMTYSLGEDGQPKVYQASSSTRTAPGGMKETRNSVSNSATGEQKLKVGRHLGDRAHIMEKAQNRYTGDQDESEELLNMEDAELGTFNQEWKQRAAYGPSRSGNAISSHPYQRPNLAITDGSNRQDDRQAQKRGKKAKKGLDKGHYSKNR